MEIEQRETPHFVIVKPLVKNLDFSIASAFKSRVITALATNKERFLLDLTDVRFIDTSGLGAILSLYKTFPNKEFFCICSAHPAVMQIFELTGLKRVFHFYPDENSALKDAGDA